MKSYDVLDDHDIPKDVEEIVENQFGDCSREDGSIVVDDPMYDILEEVTVKVQNSNTIMLDIQELSVKAAREQNCLSNAKDAVQAKNNLLRKLTGKTVEDRKEEIRQSVVDDPDPKK